MAFRARQPHECKTLLKETSMTTIALLIVLLTNDAVHDFGLIPDVDYDVIECIALYAATIPMQPTK